MDVDFWVKVASPIISATSGLVGVWIGAVAADKREINKERRVVLSDRIYLTTMLSLELERFADQCHAVANDFGTDIYGNPAGGDRETYTATTDLPKFNIDEIKGSWKSLEPEIMDKVMLLPYRIDEVNNDVAGYSFDSDPPEFTEFFNARRYFYAKLGIEVERLVDEIRLSGNLKKMPRYSGQGSRKKDLEKIVADIHTRIFG